MVVNRHTQAASGVEYGAETSELNHSGTRPDLSWSIARFPSAVLHRDADHARPENRFQNMLELLAVVILLDMTEDV